MFLIEWPSYPMGGKVAPVYGNLRILSLYAYVIKQVRCFKMLFKCLFCFRCDNSEEGKKKLFLEF